MSSCEALDSARPKAERVASSFVFLALSFLGAVAPSAAQELSEEELAKETKNPVANLISVPFQNNTSYDFGPRERTQNVMGIQPVIPISIHEDWNLITRTILPVVSQPSFARGQDRQKEVGSARPHVYDRARLRASASSVRHNGHRRSRRQPLELRANLGGTITCNANSAEEPVGA
jgi:hypothetical protein